MSPESVKWPFKWNSFWENSSTAQKTPFEEFLLIEYTNLAQAFFSAATSITQFFQYYLLALGVPLTAVGVIAKLSNGKLEEIQVSGVSAVLGALFLVVSVVGVCVATYIMNLRFDALLYARAVNGIRRYFYGKSTLQKEMTMKTRVLYIDVDKPLFFEGFIFLPVVFAFAVLNSAYLFLGVSLLKVGILCASLFTGVFFVGHVVWYGILAGRREKTHKSWALRDYETTPQDQPTT
jgi:hypothetical protein